MKQNETTLEDYQWLVSTAAADWIQAAVGASQAVSVVKRLRAHLSPARTHLVLELADLRRRAAKKFSAADRLFFTSRGLEQATDEVLADYKASRMTGLGRFADLCAGIGGDLMSLARVGPCEGVEWDVKTACLAKANCQTLGLDNAAIQATDVHRFPLPSADLVHLDPDRRALGKRTTRLESCQPNHEFMDRVIRQCDNICLKLAPATRLEPNWTEQAEIEFLGSRGECRQQVVWFGDVARQPGKTVATIVDAEGGVRTVVKGVDRPAPLSRPMDFVFEPHATVIAAGLVESVAAEHAMHRLAAGVPYLTAASPILDGALQSFQVEDVLPMDLRRVKSYLEKRQIGIGEVKKRGVPLDPLLLQRKLRREETETRTLILYPGENRVQCIVAKRIRQNGE